MTLAEFRDWIRQHVDSPFWYVGTTNKSKEQCIGLFNVPGAPPRIAVGGMAHTSYQNKIISILIRWGKNANLAEIKANEVYEVINAKTVKINGKKTILQARQGQPIDIGMDGENNYEYVVEVLLKYEI